jgi:hypothetical protein
VCGLALEFDGTGRSYPSGGAEYRAGLCDEAQVVRVELGHDVRQHVEGHEQHGTRLVSAVLYEPRQGHVSCLSGHLQRACLAPICKKQKKTKMG